MKLKLFQILRMLCALYWLWSCIQQLYTLQFFFLPRTLQYKLLLFYQLIDIDIIIMHDILTLHYWDMVLVFRLFTDNKTFFHLFHFINFEKVAVGPSKKDSQIPWPEGVETRNLCISRFNVHDPSALKHEHSSIWWPVGIETPNWVEI